MQSMKQIGNPDTDLHIYIQLIFNKDNEEVLTYIVYLVEILTQNHKINVKPKDYEVA